MTPPPARLVPSRPVSSASFLAAGRQPQHITSSALRPPSFSNVVSLVPPRHRLLPCAQAATSTCTMAPTDSGRRRRVRTGCLTCRGRRRKCDEGKPTCQNCRDRKLTCRYGVKHTFVHCWSESQQCHPRQEDAVSPAGKIADPAMELPAAREEGRARRDRPIQRHQTTGETGDVASNWRMGAEGGPPGVDLHNDDILPLSPNASSPPDDLRITRAASLTGGRPPPSYLPSSGNSNEPLAGANARTASQAEGDRTYEALSHYRYHIAPLLDLNEPTQYWGVHVILSSRTNSGLHDAICALSRTMKYPAERAGSAPNRRPDGAGRMRPVQHADGFADAESVATAVLRSWICVLDYSPSRWLYGLSTEGFQAISGRMDDARGLAWTRVRLAALVTATPAASASWLRACSVLDFDRSSCDSVQSELQQILLHLETALLLCTGMPPARSGLSASSLTWQSCWKDVQMWYARRSRDFRPLFDSLIREDGDSGQTATFPTVVFGNTCASLANIVLHLSALFLIQCKPRLVKTHSRPPAFMSSTWHVLRILGIAAVAVADEFWDPLLIAAVLKACAKLSDKDQLDNAFAILRTVQAHSGIALDDELTCLQNGYIEAIRDT